MLGTRMFRRTTNYSSLLVIPGIPVLCVRHITPGLGNMHQLMETASAKPGRKLLDQVSDVARFRHLSLRTEQAYRNWIKRYILFHGKRHPRELDAEAVRAFLTHLAVHDRVSASTQNQAFNALLFLYRQVLNSRLD